MNAGTKGVGLMYLGRWTSLFGAMLLVAAMMSCPAVAEEVDPTTLNGKMIFGYQGWFGCPGDGSGRGWVHWMNDRQQPTVDMLPDVSELDQDELCDSGWTAKDGSHIQLFSSQNPKTVDRHFAWMETYGLDGIALQKFASVLLDPKSAAASDRVLANVRAGAARHGRVYFLMYDLSGRTPEQLALVTADWKRLIADGITADRAYQHHNGRPVLGLWGIGFAGRKLPPAAVEAFLDEIRSASATAGGVTILGGVPAWWRERRGDADDDPGWAEVWPKLDVISPWTVGRYADEAGADTYREKNLIPDIAAAKELKVEYMPVVFPGFSWANLQIANRAPDKAPGNLISRRCGAFYQRQVLNAIQSGARIVYAAMFDEVDEGTAMFKLVPRVITGSATPQFVPPDVNECNLNTDRYLEIGKHSSGALKKIDLSAEKTP